MSLDVWKMCDSFSKKENFRCLNRHKNTNTLVIKIYFLNLGSLKLAIFQITFLKIDHCAAWAGLVQYVLLVSFGFRRRMAIYAQRNSILPLLYATSSTQWFPITKKGDTKSFAIIG